ncbi:MAG: DUF72 domain-containing protein [Chryseobacterium sp.]|nr:DUF72 domain-containing protein [Chryseobacterium sp.]
MQLKYLEKTSLLSVTGNNLAFLFVNTILIFLFVKNIHINCYFFYGDKWKNVFNPEKVLSANWFKLFCMHFNTLKINDTVCKSLRLRILINWDKKNLDGFIDSVKAPKLITHIKKFMDYKPELDEFFLLCRQGLNDKLDIILFQFPSSFLYRAKKLNLLVQAENLHGIPKIFYSEYSHTDLTKLQKIIIN